MVDRLYPAWRPDGKTMYYLNPAGEMVAAPITVVGDTLEPRTPVVRFPAHIVYGGVDNQFGSQYDVAPDGRFLINTELPGDAAPIDTWPNRNWIWSSSPPARWHSRAHVRRTSCRASLVIPASAAA